MKLGYQDARVPVGEGLTWLLQRRVEPYQAKFWLVSCHKFVLFFFSRSWVLWNVGCGGESAQVRGWDTWWFGIVWYF